MIPLTQKQKNKVFRPMYNKLEKLENKMIKEGIDHNDPKSIRLNEKWLTQYESIQNTINYIQFHDIYSCIVPRKYAKIGFRFNTIVNPFNKELEIVAITNRYFSAVSKNDCRYILAKFIGNLEIIEK